MGDKWGINKVCLICQTEIAKCSSYMFKRMGSCNISQSNPLNIDVSAIKQISICTNCFAARGVVL